MQQTVPETASGHRKGRVTDCNVSCSSDQQWRWTNTSAIVAGDTLEMIREIARSETVQVSRDKLSSVYAQSVIVLIDINLVHIFVHEHYHSKNYQTKNWTVHGQLRHPNFPASSQHHAPDLLAMDIRVLYKFILHYIYITLSFIWLVHILWSPTVRLHTPQIFLEESLEITTASFLQAGQASQTYHHHRQKFFGTLMGTWPNLE